MLSQQEISPTLLTFQETSSRNNPRFLWPSRSHQRYKRRSWMLIKIKPTKTSRQLLESSSTIASLKILRSWNWRNRQFGSRQNRCKKKKMLYRISTIAYIRRKKVRLNRKSLRTSSMRNNSSLSNKRRFPKETTSLNLKKSNCSAMRSLNSIATSLLWRQH